MKIIKINDKTFVESITEDELSAKVKILASELNRDFVGKEPIILIVLKGALLFGSDLIKNLNFNFEVEFIKVSSYKNDIISSGSVEVIDTIDSDIFEKDVIIIEDIIDTGNSLENILEYLKKYNPNSIKIVTLLDKPYLRQNNLKPDYCGFEVENKFVIGYGLDYAQKFRNLRSIFVLSE